MGQMTFAVMYGIEEPAGVDFWGEDGESGLLRDWTRACAEKIDRYDTKHGGWSGESVYVPQRPYQGTLDIVGFYVAIGAGGEEGVPALEGFPLSANGVREAHPDGYKAARRRWRRFAKWCASKGIALPKARLYLTETEVA